MTKRSLAGVPVRYIHSMNCITSGWDFEQTVRLAEATVRSMTAGQIAGF